MKTRILVVEDDAALARVLRDNLTFEGFEVECAADAHAAVERTKHFAPDLVVLDVMLPGGDGFKLCGQLRQSGRAAVVMLTARSHKVDKIRGLALGADDYVTKPFDLEELLARIKAVLRRARPGVDRLVLGEVTIDFKTLQAAHGREPMQLSHREFDVLRYLAERRGHVVSRSELLSQVWSYADTPITRSVDHAIARLRKKIEYDAHTPRFIHTVHGDGYCLTPAGAADNTAS
jgi:two-component system response regulator VicR